MITSGIQGDEPAGPISLLEWVEVNKVPSNIFIIPIVSAESYLNKTHFDDSGKNVDAIAALSDRYPEAKIKARKVKYAEDIKENSTQ